LGIFKVKMTRGTNKKWFQPHTQIDLLPYAAALQLPSEVVLVSARGGIAATYCY